MRHAMWTATSPDTTPVNRSHRWTVGTLAVVVSLGTLLSGCGTGKTSSTAAVTSTADQASSPLSATASPTAAAAPVALQFTAPLVGGGELDASTLANGEPVLFWFWAPF